jgi:peptidoglycan hydrolase-like protein with peptidoglycan-binding domain
VLRSNAPRSSGEIGPRGSFAAKSIVLAKMREETRDIEWSIWVFAAPGALRGLARSEGELELVDGADATVAAMLERAFATGRLPDRLDVFVEEVSGPSLLEILTDQWHGRRSRWRAGARVSEVERSVGARDLETFLRCAAEGQPQAGRRALVLLGDLLRADEYFESGVEFEPGRPGETQPQTVRIKTGKEEDHVYELRFVTETTESATGRTETTTTPSHYECQTCTTTTTLSIETVDEMLAAGTAEVVDDSTTTTTTRAAVTSATSRSPRLHDRDSRPKRSFAGGEPEPVSRAARRVTKIVTVLERAGIHFDLLVTDRCEATVFEELQRLAPHVDVIVGSQVEAPLATWPLVDLFVSLPEALEPERIAAEMVGSRRQQQQRTRLWRACQTTREVHDWTSASERDRLARRVLRAGHDAVALRTQAVEELATHIGALGRTLARLIDGSELSTHVQLRRRIERANYRYDDHSERADLGELLEQLLDGESGLPPAWRRELGEPVAAIRRCLETEQVVLAQVHLLGRGPDRGPLGGLSLHLPLRCDELGSEPAASVNPQWRPVLEALHFVDPSLDEVGAEDRARVASERRMHQDMAAFRHSAGEARAVEDCENLGDRRAWAMLHYLPGDNPRGGSMVTTMAGLADWAYTSARTHVAALLDRPPPTDERAVAEGLRWTLEDASLTGEPVPAAITDERQVVWTSSWTRADGSAGLLAVSSTGEVLDLPFDAHGFVDGEILHRFAEPGALVVDAYGEPGEQGIELRASVERPHHAARLLPGQVAGAWLGFANVEQLDAINSGTEAQLRGFLEQALRASPARHVGLVLAGRADFGGGFCLCHDTFETSFLTIPQIARCLRAALEALDRGPLALLILEDPNMMSLEVAYELRDVAQVLMTPTASAELDCVELLRHFELLLGNQAWGLEARAYRALGDCDESYEVVAGRWRHLVARFAAEELIDASRYPSLRRSPAVELDASTLDLALAFNTAPHCRRPSCDSPRFDRATIELVQRVVGAPVDGVFDAVTVEALFVWQGRFGLEQTGKLDDATLARLRELFGHVSIPAVSEAELATAHDRERDDERGLFAKAQGLVDHAPPPLPKPPKPPKPGYGEAPSFPPELIEKVQTIVGVPSDGELSAITTHALIVWQQIVGLPPTGELDEPTLALIEDFDAALDYNRKRQLPPETVERLQRVVGAPVDGVIGPITTQALYVWQARVGLDQDGKLDDKSLELAEAEAERLPRLQAIDLTLVERLGRRIDAVCRAALRQLGESAMWESVEFTAQRAPDRHSLRSLLADMKVGPAVARVNEFLEHGPTKTGPGLWIGKPSVRSYGRLLVYTKADPSEDYLDLEIHRHVRLYALLSSYRMLAEHADHPHRLWGLVSAGIAFTPAPIRDRLLSTLIGRPVDPGLVQLQFASMAAAPLITLALEDDDTEPERYELRLTSSESTALLLRQHSRVNPEAIEHALAGLDFLLAGRQTSRTTWAYLESLGSSLGEDIINHLHDRLELERKQLLASSHSNDAHLALAIPRKLMRYPWELMLVPTDAGLRRKQMLCERFAVGRQVWSDRGRRVSTSEGRDTKIKALIIGDPKVRGVAELPAAREEARAIAEIFVEIDGELGDEMDFDRERDVFIHTTMTRAAIRRLLRDGDYDIVHFAGHASFSAEQPERSAWLLSDGPLWASELRNTLAWCPNPPWMIFANACHAAMTSDREPSRYQGEVYGLAEACIQEGVSAYVAPLWQVGDEPARLLATTLYRALLLDRTTVGAALRQARMATRRLCEDRSRTGGVADISWASVVLYGNPTDRLFAALGTDLPTV